MKYKLTDETRVWEGRTLHRIQALCEFGNVKKGQFGGWIQKESNLSQEGDCWVNNNAIVCDNATVRGDAYVGNNAIVYEFAQITENARVAKDVIVRERADISGNAFIGDQAMIRGEANITDYATILDNSIVSGNALVCGSATVRGNVIIASSIHLRYGVIYEYSMKNIIACSLNVLPIKGNYYLYKRVWEEEPGVYSSAYDRTFIYRDGQIAIADDYDPDQNKSCASGLHVSTPDYWPGSGNTTIACEVNEEDVICCLQGKLRVKKLKVLGKVEGGKNE